MKKIPVLLLAAIILLCIECTTTSEQSGEMKVGIGVVDNTGVDAVILDPLKVKAVLFRQGNEVAIIVECDYEGIPRAIVEEGREKISEKLDIPVEKICIAATHSHTALCSKDLVSTIVDAAIAAEKNLKPVQLSSGVGQEFNVSYNRRYYMKDGTVLFNPMFLNPDIVKPAGPTDPDVGFVLINDAQTGEPIASISNYALHLDVVREYGARHYDEAGYEKVVSADYPYWLEKALKEKFGEDFTSVFYTGCCGNINHWDFSKPGFQSGHDTKAREIGDSLYQAIERILPELNIETPSLAVKTKIINAPLLPYTEEEVIWAQNLEGNDQSNVSEELDARQTFLNGVKKRTILWLEDQKEKGFVGSLPMEVQVIRISNNTAIVTLPSEMFVELGLAIKNFSPFDNTILVELANNDYMEYIPNKMAYKKGGYEVVDARLAAGGGELIVCAAVELLNEIKQDQPAVN